MNLRQEDSLAKANLASASGTDPPRMADDCREAQARWLGRRVLEVNIRYMSSRSIILWSVERISRSMKVMRGSNGSSREEARTSETSRCGIAIKRAL